jgi:hypothetical protein
VEWVESARRFCCNGFGESMAGRMKLAMQTIELDPESLTRLRRGTMARFCASLTADDWLQLEALPERVRNGVLVLAVQQLLKRRTQSRRPLGRMVGKERGLLEGRKG